MLLEAHSTIFQKKISKVAVVMETRCAHNVCQDEAAKMHLRRVSIRHVCYLKHIQQYFRRSMYGRPNALEKGLNNYRTRCICSTSNNISEEVWKVRCTQEGWAHLTIFQKKLISKEVWKAKCTQEGGSQ
jgi:hypothetical protein